MKIGGARMAHHGPFSASRLGWHILAENGHFISNEMLQVQEINPAKNLLASCIEHEMIDAFPRIAELASCVTQIE